MRGTWAPSACQGLTLPAWGPGGRGSKEGGGEGGGEGGEEESRVGGDRAADTRPLCPKAKLGVSLGVSLATCLLVDPSLKYPRAKFGLVFIFFVVILGRNFLLR